MIILDSKENFIFSLQKGEMCNIILNLVHWGKTPIFTSCNLREQKTNMGV